MKIFDNLKNNNVIKSDLINNLLLILNDRLHQVKSQLKIGNLLCQKERNRVLNSKHIGSSLFMTSKLNCIILCFIMGLKVKPRSSLKTLEPGYQFVMRRLRLLNQRML